MYKQAGQWYSPSGKQKAYASRLGREIRDRLEAQGAVEVPSAHFLAKYFTIDSLKDAITDIEDGIYPHFEGHGGE